MNISQRKINELTGGLKPIDVRAALFKKGDFDFIVRGLNEDGVEVVHEKQRKALEILTCGKYEEFLYGGAAGGAKSWTGCAWIMFMAICYPGTKYFIARNELKDILDSVLVTFNKVAKEYGFTDFKFNAVKNFIQLGNGSHINFIEIKYKPSDPMFEDVGSTEYTCGWIEEVGEIHETGAAVIASRVGRHLNGKYGIKGTVFYTCNPKRNWAKTLFYDKSKNGTLEDDKAYLGCLITENPFIEKDYVRKLQKIGEKDKSLYERLFRGNWDYEDNPYQLAEQEMIDGIFENDQVQEGKTYLTCDVARQGSDKAVIVAWRGWIVEEIITYDKSSIPDIVHAIKYLRNKYKIARTRCIADGDGVGGGVIDYSNIKEFKNNGKPIRQGKDTLNYRNLQIQCLYLFAEKINEGEVWIRADLEQKVKEEIKTELAQIQSVPNKRGGEKLDCKTKGQIKTDIGRSPDYRDALFMRVFFDLKKGTANLTTTWS
jgi:phage terminase large subunit